MPFLKEDKIAEIKATLLQWQDPNLPVVSMKDKLCEAYQARAKAVLLQILETPHLDVMFSHLETYLKQQWDLIKGTCLCYTSIPEAKITRLSGQIAILLCEYKNQYLVDKPVTPIELLMPGINVDATNPAYPCLGAIPAEHFTQDERDELNDVICYIKHHPKRCDVSEERIARLRHAYEREGRVFKGYKGLNALSAFLKATADADAIDAVIHDFLQDRQTMLQDKKARVDRQEAQVKEGQLIRHSETYLIAAIALEDLLKTHIVSHDCRSLIPVWVLTDEPSQRPYQDVLNLEPLTQPQLESEFNRLINHSPSAFAVYEARQYQEELSKAQQSSLYDHLQTLLKKLKENDAHHGIGREEDAAVRVYEPIRVFMTYYDTLGYQLRLLEPSIQESQLSSQYIYVAVTKGATVGAFSVTCKLKLPGDVVIHETLSDNDFPELSKKLKRLNDQSDIFEALHDYKTEVIALLDTKYPSYHITALEEKSKLPHELRQSLDKLYRLSFDASENINATQNLETCIAIRGVEIQQAMQGQAPLLRSIACTDEKNTMLKTEAETRLAAVIESFGAFIKKPLYGTSHDKLPITATLMDEYKIEVSIKSLEDVKILLEDELPELKNMLREVQHIDEVLNLFSDLESLVNFLHEISSTHLFKFLQVISKRLIARFFVNESNRYALLSSFEGEKYVLLVRFMIQHGESYLKLLHFALSHVEQLKSLIQLIPKSVMLTMVKQKYGHGTTLLHYASNTPESIKLILDLVPENQRFDAVKEKDHHGITVLHRASNHSESLKHILASLPEHQRFDAVKVKNDDDEMVLHYASHAFESLKQILLLLPEHQRVDAVTERGRYGATVLHRISSTPEYMKQLLELLPENRRVEALKVKNGNGATVLHKASLTPESVRLILKLLSKSQCLDLLKEKNFDGTTVFHSASDQPESLKLLLEFYPENQRVDVIKKKDRYGDTVLHSASTMPESLKQILELLPESHRLAVLKERNRDDETVLHRASNAPESLKQILALLPESQRLDVVKEKDHNGVTVLHKATCNVASLKQILVSLSATQCLNAIIEKDVGGKSLYHLVVNHPEIFNVLLDSLPINQKIERPCRKALLDKLMFYLDAPEQSGCCGMFQFFGTTNYAKKIDAISKFLTSSPLTDDDLNMLRQEKTAAIFDAHQVYRRGVGAQYECGVA